MIMPEPLQVYKQAIQNFIQIESSRSSQETDEELEHSVKIKAAQTAEQERSALISKEFASIQQEMDRTNRELQRGQFPIMTEEVEPEITLKEGLTFETAFTQLHLLEISTKDLGKEIRNKITSLNAAYYTRGIQRGMIIALSLIIIALGIFQAYRIIYIQTNLNNAQTALSNANWEEARAKADAVLKMDGTNQEAKTIIIESYYRAALLAYSKGNWSDVKNNLIALNNLQQNYKSASDLLEVAISHQPLPTSTPSVPTATPPLPTDTPSSGLIPFASPDNLQILNPTLGWQPDGSTANDYDLESYPAGLAIIAAPRTNQWGTLDTAPLITFPFQGDFEAQVKAVCHPVPFFQLCGLGVRSTQSHSTWLRISKDSTDIGSSPIIWATANQQGVPIQLNRAPYADDTVYLKILRKQSLFNLLYSLNGNNWVTLQSDYLFEISDAIEVFLIVYSDFTNDGFIAQFYDFSVFSK